ncbi:MAG: hypothetical protein ACT6S0_12405 [Roseateles sp.]|uniref:hypothetical protein n=1 Tax=Roseateles sp. TaxID=1971397 RepID=UPI004036EE83
MAQPDPFDPTHALDGWRVPAPPAVDLALKLDSLRPASRRAPNEVDTRLVMPRAEREAFDSTHALDGWRAPSLPPLDLKLNPLLRAGGAKLDDAKKAWVKARGYEMQDVEDIEVAEKRPLPARIEVAEAPALSPAAMVAGGPIEPPAPEAMPQSLNEAADQAEVAAAPVPVDGEAPVLDFRAEPPPAAPDLLRVIGEVKLPHVPRPPVVVEAPVLELPAAPNRPARDPRLLSRWQPLAWTALARRVRGATTEVVQTPDGPLVQTHMPQWLCALWRPQSVDAPLLGRWPELAGLIGADTVFGALHQLLAELPPRAQIWSAGLEADWVLVAELVLHQDAGLRLVHAQALRELIDAERSASLARVNGHYAAKGGVVRRRV